MPKQRKPERDQAKEIYLKAKGKIKPKEIAERLGVNAALVRKWKNLDKWEDDLHRKRRGGQPGNKNSKGHKSSVPKGNTNAETHGAYSGPRMQNWPEEDRQRIEETAIQFSPLAEQQYKRLLAKQEDLERRIAALDGEEDGQTLYLDRVMTMEMPGGQEMKYRSESSAHARRMVYEAELNRVHGRIIKLLDSLRGKEQAERQMAFEREKFEFAKQKALGVFDDDSEPDSEEDSVEEIIDE